MASRFEFRSTRLPGVWAVRRLPVGDARGFFARFYCQDEFAEIGLNKPITQINHTLTRKKGVVRGMHFQYPPHAETKLVSCLSGEILDVAIDIRRGSPTFLKWHGEMLSAENQTSLFIPEGFAHGFQTLTDDCELIYLHTAEYNREAESGISAVDPAVGIEWSLPISELSERDQNHAMLGADFSGIDIS